MPSRRTRTSPVQIVLHLFFGLLALGYGGGSLSGDSSRTWIHSIPLWALVVEGCSALLACAQGARRLLAERKTSRRGLS